MLQRRHYAFRVFWDMAAIEFSKEIDTLAVFFDPNSFAPTLLINKEFWAPLDDENKLFLIMHECFHVLFDHFTRFAKYFKTKYKEYCNVACDIVINEMLTSSFGFDRDKLDDRLYHKDNPSSGAWIDNVFGEHKDKILPDKSSQYYLDKLIEIYGEPPEMPSGGSGEGAEMPSGGGGEGGLPSGFDVHIVIEPNDGENMRDAVEQSGMVEMLDENLEKSIGDNDDYKEAVSKLNSPAGTGHGGWIKVNVGRVKLKKKWEEVIDHFSRRLMKTTAKLEERWDRVKPLYQPLLSKVKDIKLPSSTWIITESDEEQKGLVYMFLDCSGSCIGLKDRFFKAARSIDPRKIDVRLFSFDDTVTELDIRYPRVSGGYGTRFNIIEQKIQEIIEKEHCKYPDQVFIITDGYGDSVAPAKPERWIWFLTENGGEHYIPAKSKVFNLKDFE